MRRSWVLGLAVFLVAIAAAAWAAPYDAVLGRWSKTENFFDRGDSLYIRATYYSAEYIEASIQQEADKNLWTDSELETHKYQLLKTLKLEDSIPIRVEFENRGSALHMAPFGKQVRLWIGKKHYEPKDYDPRLNFRTIDKVEGMVYFPRFDEKSGKDLLKGVKSVKFELTSGVSMTMRGKSASFIWEVADDNPDKIFAGAAGKKIEMDRLIKRLEKLGGEKKDLQARLDEIQAEIDKIQARMNELQKQ